MIQEAELDHVRSQLKKVMSQRDIRVKLEMIQKDLSSKKTQERRLMVGCLLKAALYYTQ